MVSLSAEILKNVVIQVDVVDLKVPNISICGPSAVEAEPSTYVLVTIPHEATLRFFTSELSQTPSVYG